MSTGLGNSLFEGRQARGRVACALLAAIVTAVLLAVLALMGPGRAWATGPESGDALDASRSCSLTVSLRETKADGTFTLVTGGTVAIYRVASAQVGDDGTLTFTACAPFDGLGISSAYPEALPADRLASWVLSNAGKAAVAPLQTAEPNGYGTLGFSDLECGVYLVCQLSDAPGYYPFKPFVAVLPAHTTSPEGWVYDRTAYPKIEPRPEGPVATTSVTVWKAWVDGTGEQATSDGGASATHDPVSVELTVNGEAYARVELSDSNDWTYTWQNIPLDAELAVREPDVPEGYEVSYNASGDDEDGHGLIVTNTLVTPTPTPDPTPTPTPTPDSGGTTPSSDTTSPSRLIQTGQLNWPVPVLALAGIVLFTLGWRRSRHAAPAPKEDAPDER